MVSQELGYQSERPLKGNQENTFTLCNNKQNYAENIFYSEYILINVMTRKVVEKGNLKMKVFS